ncbi:MAG TPA: hypothetical protein VJT49_26875 [Amycolatopsis sp.]|nr:hypothetical protein [Amycolatopsis sp.]HKS48665.1 hypothetical protein [Amycolatopsis sp.]
MRGQRPGTRYDSLQTSGVPREEARDRIHDEIDRRERQPREM